MKLKKPNYKKWETKECISIWETICLFCEIEPPETFLEFLEMRKNIQKIRDMEEKFFNSKVFGEIKDRVTRGTLH